MLPEDVALRLFRSMTTIREFETAARRLLREGKIGGGVHLSLGQEAVAAGVCDVLRVDDYITTTHRGHGHCVAKGAEIWRMFAELLGRADGYCGGKAGSMHMADPERGILGATAIVGGGLPMAIGAAFSARFRGTDQVSVAFFGEGAVAQGTFHESLNLGALWRLPVVFVCENNQYAELTHVSLHLAARVHRLGEPYGIPSVHLDGNNVEAVRDAAEEAIARARAGEGPSLLECETYRFGGHYEGDPETYRSSAEVEERKRRDPIRLLRELLASVEDASLGEIDREVEQLIAGALAKALESPLPALSGLAEDVYARGGAHG